MRRGRWRRDSGSRRYFWRFYGYVRSLVERSLGAFGPLHGRAHPWMDSRKPSADNVCSSSVLRRRTFRTSLPIALCRGGQKPPNSVPQTVLIENIHPGFPSIPPRRLSFDCSRPICSLRTSPAGCSGYPALHKIHGCFFLLGFRSQR